MTSFFRFITAAAVLAFRLAPGRRMRRSRTREGQRHGTEGAQRTEVPAHRAGRQAAACRVRPECPGDPTTTTRRPHPAAYGSPPTAASRGNLFSTTSRLVDRVSRRSPPRIRTSSTSVQAKRTSAATSRRATASTRPSTAARRGRTSGNSAARSGRWPSIPPILTSRSRRCSAGRSARTRNAVYTARKTAARPGSRC